MPELILLLRPTGTAKNFHGHAVNSVLADFSQKSIFNSMYFQIKKFQLEFVVDSFG